MVTYINPLINDSPVSLESINNKILFIITGPIKSILCPMADKIPATIN